MLNNVSNFGLCLGGDNMDFERGLDALGAQLERTNRYLEFTTLEARLRENLREPLRFLAQPPGFHLRAFLDREMRVDVVRRAEACPPRPRH